MIVSCMKGHRITLKISSTNFANFFCLFVTVRTRFLWNILFKIPPLIVTSITNVWCRKCGFVFEWPQTQIVSISRVCLFLVSIVYATLVISFVKIGQKNLKVVSSPKYIYVKIPPVRRWNIGWRTRNLSQLHDRQVKRTDEVCRQCVWRQKK